MVRVRQGQVYVRSWPMVWSDRVQVPFTFYARGLEEEEEEEERGVAHFLGQVILVWGLVQY